MLMQILTRGFVLLRTADRDSTEGQSLVEYSLVILLVAISAILVVTGLGAVIRDTLYGEIQDVLIPALGG